MYVSQLEPRARTWRHVNYGFEKYLNETLAFITAGITRLAQADLAGDVISTALQRQEQDSVLFGFCMRKGLLQVKVNNVRVGACGFENWISTGAFFFWLRHSEDMPKPSNQ